MLSNRIKELLEHIKEVKAFNPSFSSLTVCERTCTRAGRAGAKESGGPEADAFHLPGTRECRLPLGGGGSGQGIPLWKYNALW